MQHQSSRSPMALPGLSNMRLSRSTYDGIWPALVKTVSKAITAYSEWRRYRKDYETLRSMDDRMLRDIGLSRSDIERSFREGL